MRWLACVLTIAAPAAAAQSTWYVDVHGTAPGAGTALDPYTSIQYAIDRSTTLDGDTLLVLPGTYVENLTLEKQIAVRSTAGPLATILRPAQPGRVLELDGILDENELTVLEGFTITGAFGSVPPHSAPLLVRSTSGTLSHCIVLGSGTDTGVMVDYDVKLESSLVTGCTRGLSTIGLTAVFMRNSIVWGNVHDSQANLVVVDYCAGFGEGIDGDGTGNIVGDPRLWDLASGEFRLAPGSPCIDAGDPASPLDPDGSRADMGPLPYEPTYAPAPTAYCTAKSNSLACVPSIGSSGTPSASGSPFVVTCTNELNQRPGLLFYGYAPNGITFQGGWLCVKAPTKRTPIADSGGSSTGLDCSGAYAFDFDARIQSGIDPALVAGEMVYCQFWSRDGGDPTGFGSNRSDALRFGIAP